MLELHTLGELRLQGAPETALSSRRKELALLTYLARRAPKAVSRDELADLLWGDRELGKGRQSLRQALLELKRIVGDGLEIAPESVGLRSGAVTCDAAGFEQDVAHQRWREAVQRWRGDFLRGLEQTGGEEFRAWLEAEREGLRRGLRKAYANLVDETRRTGAWLRGIEYAGSWVEMLPFDEEAHRKLVELLHLSGRTAEALAQHTASRSQLKELGNPPGASFTELGKQLERDASRTRGPSPGSAALFTPDLVGRGPALADLLSVWDSVSAGQPGAVLVEGEAGIGKSRLCDEFLRRLAQRSPNPFLIRVRGDEALREPMTLIKELLVGLAPAPGLAGTPPKALAELARISSSLHERFHPLPEPNGSQSALEDAMLEAFRAVSDERPVVVLLEDLARGDSDSHRLLRNVLPRLVSAVLFLMTSRSGDQESSSAFVELASEYHVRRLKLQALSQPEVETLLGSMLELPGEDRHGLARRLFQQGGGNPFYTIELTAALVEEELLTPTETGSWRMVGPQSGVIPLPASIREVVTRRLDRLPPSSRSALEAGAVLGRTFDPELIPEVSGLDASASSIALEDLIARRMVRQASDSPAHYEFTHEITGRVAYDLIPAKRRETLHRGAARAYQAAGRHDPTHRAAYQYHRARGGRRAGPWGRRLLETTLALVALLAGYLGLMPSADRASLVTLLTRRTPDLFPNRIVVAPLANHTADSALSGLGALAADWIAQSLMRTTQFEVVDPRTSSVAGRIVNHIPSILRDRNPAVALAEETGAGKVVSGDLYRDGDSLRVLVRVTDAASGQIVRAVSPISGTMAGATRLVSDLGTRVLAVVASAVDTTSRGFSAALGQPPSYEAYSEVSRAWESFFRNDIADVFARLDRASLLDSTYMTPLLMRAYVQTRLGVWPAVDSLVHRLENHSALLTPAERAVLAGLEADLRGDLWGRLRAARELMNLTPASVEGYTLAASSALYVNHPREALSILNRIDPDRGLLLVAPFYWLDQTPAFHRIGDHRAEIASAKAGLRRFPDRYWTHLNLLLALAAEGDIRALRRELPRVTRDDPDPALGARQKAFYVWRELRAHGHTAQADAWLAELMELSAPVTGDTSLDAIVVEGDLEGAVGRWDRARTIYAEGLTRHPNLPILLGRLGTAAIHTADTAEARRLDAQLAALSKPYLFGSATYARARIAAAQGNKAAAVDLLRAAWFQGRPLAFDNDGNEDIHSDPEFDSLRDFYPFQALLRID